MRDLKSTVVASSAMDPQTINTDTTTNGNIIDLQDYGSCTFIAYIGDVTTGDLTVLIQEGDDSGLSDAAAVADADLVGTELAASFTEDADDDQVHTIGYIGDKRYVRFNYVSSDTANVASAGAIALLGHVNSGVVAADQSVD